MNVGNVEDACLSSVQKYANLRISHPKSRAVNLCGQNVAATKNMAGRHVAAVLAMMGIFTASIISAETAEVRVELMHEIKLLELSHKGCRLHFSRKGCVNLATLSIALLALRVISSCNLCLYRREKRLTINLQKVRRTIMFSVQFVVASDFRNPSRLTDEQRKIRLQEFPLLKSPLSLWVMIVN